MDQSEQSSPFPRAPLFGVALLVLISLVAAVVVRTTGVGASHKQMTEEVISRDFRFEDRSDGSIAVFDAKTNHVVDTVAPGTNGFLRGTLRGLARERKRFAVMGSDSGPEVPFQLSVRADGRITLDDPVTGRSIDLESFGPTNAAVFARIMSAQKPAQHAKSHFQ
jgi:putative photosynthetic complex assembly protein